VSVTSQALRARGVAETGEERLFLPQYVPRAKADAD
jgi:hypothetical protein